MNRPDRLAAARDARKTSFAAVAVKNGATAGVAVRERSARLYTGTTPYEEVDEDMKRFNVFLAEARIRLLCQRR
jgi:hypothetical protein